MQPGMQRCGLSEQVSLHALARIDFKEVQLRMCFHAFSNYMQLEVPCDGQNRLHDGFVASIVGNVSYKTAINF